MRVRPAPAIRPAIRAAIRAVLATALVSAVALGTTLAAAPAQAGGPTSAILSIPGAGQTSSLYFTDPAYDELARLVGMSGAMSQTTEGEQSDAGHANGVGVTVTWLIHDVQPWRVDRIYLGGADGPWISTQTSMAGSIWEAPVLWHQPENGKRLAALLDELGVGTKASADTPSGGVAGAPAPPAGADETAPPAGDRQPAAAETAWWAGAGWALGGPVVGLVVGLLVAVAWRRRRRADDGDDNPVVPAGEYAEVLVR